jgi:hypothetical protein
MAKKLYFDTDDEFQYAIDGKSLEISNAIINIALKNLKTQKRFIHALEVYILDDDKIYDITIDRRDMLETLESNLEIQEYHEEYEMCSTIKKAIDKLKSK